MSDLNMLFAGKEVVQVNTSVSPTPAATRTVASVGPIGIGAGASGSATASFSPTFTRAVVIATRFGLTTSVNFAINANVMLSEGAVFSTFGVIDGINTTNSTGAAFLGSSLNHTAKSHDPGIPIASTSIALFVQNTTGVITVGVRVNALVEA